MQIVYLSNRPQVFNETWAHVRHFMPWVDRALVVAPPAMHDEFGTGPGVTLIDEQELTAMSGPELGALDHVRRNVTLRRALLGTDLVDEVFLLSDDDYRPLKPVDETFFIEDGRHIGYYCHDLSSWPGFSTPFDEAQHVTSGVLSYLGAPRLAYGSHMPQIMKRDYWNEAFETLDELRPDSMICEWGLYFNIAQQRHTESMATPQPFQTLCWPPRLHEWQLRVRPTEYSFENFYPESYEDGDLFAGLPTALTPLEAARNTVEKLVRWNEMGRRTARMSFDPAVYNPWTKRSFGRRITFRLLRALRKGQEYVTLSEREAVAQLHGRLDEAALTRAALTSADPAKAPQRDET